jgi:hypothetical protein
MRTTDEGNRSHSTTSREPIRALHLFSFLREHGAREIQRLRQLVHRPAHGPWAQYPVS